MTPHPRLACLLILYGAWTGARAAEDSGLEFRGMVQEGEICLVNIHDPVTKVSKWVPIGSEANGVRVINYDAAAARLTLMRSGRSFVLPLKRFLVSVDGPTAPLVRLAPGEQIPASVAPDMPDYLRELPPEARRLLSGVRRRPAIRWPETPGTAPATPQ